MPTLDDVYLKFGFASEAAQLLETELGNLLFASGVLEADLINSPDPSKAAHILTFVNRQTLGQLLQSLNRATDALNELEQVLARALSERNRLAHSFYREHNLRRNSEEGRKVMMADLESIHNSLLDAYKAVMRLSGIDLDVARTNEVQTDHLPI